MRSSNFECEWRLKAAPSSGRATMPFQQTHYGTARLSESLSGRTLCDTMSLQEGLHDDLSFSPIETYRQRPGPILLGESRGLNEERP